MFKPVKILNESNKNLRKISKDVISPLSEDELDLIERTKLQLRYSQIEKYEKKYNLRPGMGMAFPQLGIMKRVIIIVHEYETQEFKDYVVVNPVITSKSVELIAADVGEGCLSVDRDVEGHVKRHARITIEGEDTSGNKISIRAREELSIAFQHEVDHLNGILFFDHIDKKNKFYLNGEVRLI